MAITPPPHLILTAAAPASPIAVPGSSSPPAPFPVQRLAARLNLKTGQAVTDVLAQGFSLSHQIVYAVKEGQIFYQGALFLDGIQSGRGPGFNNPAFARVKKVGPPEPGPYRLKGPIDTPATDEKGEILKDKTGKPINLGYHRFRLDPLMKTNRDAIEFHIRYGKGSIGCATTKNQADQNKLAKLIKEHDIKGVMVIASAAELQLLAGPADRAPPASSVVPPGVVSGFPANLAPAPAMPAPMIVTALPSLTSIIAQPASNSAPTQPR